MAPDNVVCCHEEEDQTIEVIEATPVPYHIQHPCPCSLELLKTTQMYRDLYYGALTQSWSNLCEYYHRQLQLYASKYRDYLNLGQHEEGCDNFLQD